MLFRVPSFFNWLNDETCGCGGCMICAVKQILQDTRIAGFTAENPVAVFNALHDDHGLVLGRHEGTADFILQFLNTIEATFLFQHNLNQLDAYTRFTNPMGQIFGGYTRIAKKCDQCNHFTREFQEFKVSFLVKVCCNSKRFIRFLCYIDPRCAH